MSTREAIIAAMAEQMEAWTNGGHDFESWNDEARRLFEFMNKQTDFRIERKVKPPSVMTREEWEDLYEEWEPVKHADWRDFVQHVAGDYFKRGVDSVKGNK